MPWFAILATLSTFRILSLIYFEHVCSMLLRYEILQ